MGALDQRQRLLLRAGFALLAITPAWIGIWGTVAPHAFYRQFPGAGHHWVPVLGPYDEHLVRDFASANLGLLALVIFAAVVLERWLVQGALLAYAIAGIPHLAYHAVTIDHFKTSDAIGMLAGLALNVVLPLAMLSLTRAPVRYSGEAV